MNINDKKQPPSTGVRVETLKVGAHAVRNEAISQAELDAMFKSPVLNNDERLHALRTVDAAVAAVVQNPALADGYALSDLKDLRKAIQAEYSISWRIDAAQRAHGAGLIDDATFTALTKGDVSLGAYSRAMLASLKSNAALVWPTDERMQRADTMQSLMNSLADTQGARQLTHVAQFTAVAVGVGVAADIIRRTVPPDVMWRLIDAASLPLAVVAASVVLGVTAALTLNDNVSSR